MDIYGENDCFIARVSVAQTLWRRLLGLFHPEAKATGAVLIYPCNSIHTFFMPSSIDVVFADKSKAVVSVEHRVSPNRVRLARGAYYAAELPPGLAKEKSIKVGGKLEFI